MGVEHETWMVFQMWRYADCESPQASVLKAVRPLRSITISTFRTLPCRSTHADSSTCTPAPSGHRAAAAYVPIGAAAVGRCPPRPKSARPAGVTRGERRCTAVCAPAWGAWGDADALGWWGACRHGRCPADCAWGQRRSAPQHPDPMRFKTSTSRLIAPAIPVSPWRASGNGCMYRAVGDAGSASPA